MKSRFNDKLSWIMYASLDIIARQDLKEFPEDKKAIYDYYFFTISTNELIDSPFFFYPINGLPNDFAKGFYNSMFLQAKDFMQLKLELGEDIKTVQQDNYLLKKMGVKIELISAEDRLMESYKDSFLNIRNFPNIIRQNINYANNKNKFLQGVLEAIFQVDNILTEVVEPKVQSFLQENLFLRGAQIVALPIYNKLRPEEFYKINNTKSQEELISIYRQSELHGFLDQIIVEEKLTKLKILSKDAETKAKQSKLNNSKTSYQRGQILADNAINIFRWNYLHNNKKFLSE